MPTGGSQDTTLITIIMIVMGATMLVLGSTVFRSVRDKRQVSDRLKGEGTRAPRTPAYPEKPRRNVIEDLGRRFTDPNSEELTKLRHRLMKAGYYSKSAPFIYIGVRFVALIIPQILLLFCWPMIDQYMPKHGLLMMSVGLGIISFVAPSFILDKKMATREEEYRNGFPDMMDLLVACVEAGLSLDGAVQRLSLIHI